MQIKRILRHLLCPHFRVANFFSKESLRAIEAAIREIEDTHHGEIVFAVEAALDFQSLWRGLSARERAVQVFSDLRVWDTSDNNGVLLYLLLADKDIEIVADRGIANHASAEVWQKICSEMEAFFKEKHFQEGVIRGIRLIAKELAGHFPGRCSEKNELRDTPVVP